MRTTVLIAGCWLSCILWASAQTGRQARPVPPGLPEVNPHSSAQDLAIGRKLFQGRCGHCHGLEGEGGRGAVLNTGRFRHGSSDRELFLTIWNGIRNTEMPGASNLPVVEVWRMVAYVQQLARKGASEPSRGDAAAGALVYQKNACATCHRIDGEGGLFAADLSDVGSKRAVRYLRESLVDPGADVPLEYRSVIVVDKAGTSISGIHLNEDEYSVHLRDLSGSLRSFMKHELAEITLPRQSMMPSYAALPAADLENLVAYLSSLGAGRPTGTAARRQPTETEVWTFDRLENIGGHKTTVLGEPKVVDAPPGKAIEFDGVDDALLVENHPLEGAAVFTWEAIFRPDGGQREQRWFHLNELPATGADSENRMLFEIRVQDGNWFLDSYAQSGSASKALMNRAALHPLGAWYHVASVYDGKEFRNYVNGVQENAAPLSLVPHGPGRSAIGMRINKVFFFKGAVHVARFTRKALPPSAFLKVPVQP